MQPKVESPRIEKVLVNLVAAAGVLTYGCTLAVPLVDVLGRVLSSFPKRPSLEERRGASHHVDSVVEARMILKGKQVTDAAIQLANYGDPSATREMSLDMTMSNAVHWKTLLDTRFSQYTNSISVRIIEAERAERR